MRGGTPGRDLPGPDAPVGAPQDPHPAYRDRRRRRRPAVNLTTHAISMMLCLRLSVCLYVRSYLFVYDMYI